MDKLNRKQFIEMLVSALFISVCDSLVKHQVLSFHRVEWWKTGHFVENRMILPRNEFQKKAKSKMHDNWARVLAAVSIVVSLSSVYYTRFQTPYFYAQPNQMSYWTIEANSLTDDKKPKSSQLAVHVYNDSDTPARDVLVVIQPLSLLPKITCSEAYELQEGINGAMLITIKRVPSKTTVQVDVSEDVTEYRDNPLQGTGSLVITRRKITRPSSASGSCVPAARSPVAYFTGRVLHQRLGPNTVQRLGLIDYLPTLSESVRRVLLAISAMPAAS